MKDKFTNDCLQKRLSTENHSVLVMICDVLQELPEFYLNLQEVNKNIFQSRP